jgi:hypothetical protein
VLTAGMRLVGCTCRSVLEVVGAHTSNDGGPDGSSLDDAQAIALPNVAASPCSTQARGMPFEAGLTSS